MDKVAFTGSTAVGREIASVCGRRLARTSIELGGKSAAIVLDDADIGRTAGGLRFASFMNNGQGCAAQTLVLAPRARCDELVDALAEVVSSFRVGDPLDAETATGCYVRPTLFADVDNRVRIAQEEIFGPVLPTDANWGWWGRQCRPNHSQLPEGRDAHHLSPLHSRGNV